MRWGHLDILNIAGVQRDNIHGLSDKDQIVLHETVSPDYPGWKDVIQTSEFLDNENYGIHGITDLEGHTAWALGLGNARFYHTASAGTKGSGYTNTRAIGIEQVSRVMLTTPDETKRWKIWMQRNKQITATAKLIAQVAQVHGIPLVISGGSQEGITTHWQVTQTFGVKGGHVDCWPRHMGGYYPLRRVVAEAKLWHSKWYET